MVEPTKTVGQCREYAINRLPATGTCAFTWNADRLCFYGDRLSGSTERSTACGIPACRRDDERRTRRAGLSAALCRADVLIRLAVGSQPSRRRDWRACSSLYLSACTACGAATHSTLVSMGELDRSVAVVYRGRAQRVPCMEWRRSTVATLDPKELLVLGTTVQPRPDPTFRVGGLAADDGNVVAVFGDKLRRVTSRASSRSSRRVESRARFIVERFS